VLLLLLTAVVLWAAVQVTGIIVGDRVSNQIDQREVTGNVARTISSIDFDAAQLKSTANDWAMWDDTYRFVQHPSSAYVRTNLTGSTLSGLGLDFMVFADKRGKIVYSKAIDPVSGRDVGLPSSFDSYVESLLPRLHFVHPTDSKAGAVNLPGDPALVSVAPITTSDGSARPDGYFLTGYFLTPGRVTAIRKRLLLDIAVHPASSGALSSAVSMSPKSITAIGTVAAIDGGAALSVVVTQPRATFGVTRTTVLLGGTALGIFGLILVAALGLTLDTVVLPDHLRALQSQMILDIAHESMDHLSDGLTPAAAATVCRLLLAHTDASAVAITDTQRVLGFAGVGQDHHGAGRSIMTQATRDTIATNTRKIMRGREEIGCPDPSCPFGAAIVVPLQIGRRAGGTLKFYFASARKLNNTAIALADGLSRLLSMRLDLDRSHGELIYLACHDPLTRLVNRRQFETELARELSEHQRLGGHGALLWFDLDHFKDINDCLGHAAGDNLLVALAEMLKALSRDYCTIARLGGDEFGILVPHADEQEASVTASRLLANLSETSFSIGDHEVRVSASVGLVRFPEHGQSCDELMARADLAMYEAKATGGNRIVAYTADDAWRSRMTEHIETAERIVAALREDRFELYAQPMRDLADGSTGGYELLLRMIGEDGEVIMPADFIPTAERLGVIRDIDRWVARRSIQMLAAERAAGRDTLFAINVSGAAFSDSELLDIMRDEFHNHRVEPSHLIVEITETTAIADIERAKEFVFALKAIGCRFSLDDFGSGASSFYYLKHLPVDFLKIDGGLIKGLRDDSPDVHFVRAIVEMCKGLKIRTVAEYVEDSGLLEAVGEHGVDFAQGYEIGWPLPFETYVDAIHPTADPALLDTNGWGAPICTARTPSADSVA